jgi:nitrogen fixation protein NifU and related proteins
MSDAMQLYQSIVLEHNRSPRGLGRLESPTHEADGFNPICGDRITLTINERNNTIEKVGFLAESCALCRASASVLVGTVEGLNVERAKERSRSFASMLAGGRWELDGDARVFSVVQEFPARAKCVLLPWKTFQAAMEKPLLVGHEKARVSVTTEPEVKG